MVKASTGGGSKKTRAQVEQENQALVEQARREELAKQAALEEKMRVEKLRVEKARKDLAEKERLDRLEKLKEEGKTEEDLLPFKEYEPTFLEKYVVGYLTPFEKKNLPRKARNKILLKRRVTRGIACLTVLAVVGGGATVTLNRYVWPEVDYVADKSVSGAGALETYAMALNNNNIEQIKSIVPESFIAQESNYVVNSEDQKRFIGTVLSTVSYTMLEEELYTVYGKPVLENKSPVKSLSDVMDGEMVNLSYIDYNSIPVDANTVKAFIDDNKFDVKHPDVSHNLQNLYVKYINSLAKTNSLPIKTIEWQPRLDTVDTINSEGHKAEGRRVSVSEDIALDNLLFASNEFWTSQYRFSQSALGGEGSAEYETWLGITEKNEIAKQKAEEKKKQEEAAKKAKAEADKKAKEKAEADKKAREEASKKAKSKDTKKPEASSYGDATFVAETVVKIDEPLTTEADISVEEDSARNPVVSPPKSSGFYTEELSPHSSGMEEDCYHLTPRPEVGNYKYINPMWVGAYYLQEGMVDFGKEFGLEIEPIIAPVGNGASDNTAGLNVSVLTTQIDTKKDEKTKKNKEVKTPIRVEMTSILRDQEAINYFQSKDTRNRGFLSSSQVKYIAMTFTVTNLGNDEIEIRDNSTLSDDQMNITGRTGNVFGLKEKVKLKPGQSGVIETWAASPTLDSKFVIWGKDFSRRADVVWFRQLAGETGNVTRQEGIDDAPNLVSPGTDEGIDEETSTTEVTEESVPETTGGTTEDDTEVGDVPLEPLEDISGMTTEDDGS